MRFNKVSRTHGNLQVSGRVMFQDSIRYGSDPKFKDRSYMEFVFRYYEKYMGPKSNHLNLYHSCELSIFFRMNQKSGEVHEDYRFFPPHKLMSVEWNVIFYLLHT